MATLSLHYITLRSKQIGLKLKEKKKSWLYLDVVWFFIIRAMFSTKVGLRNELCLNEVDAQKVSDSFCFFFFFSLCLKAGWDVLLLYSRIPLNPVHRPARCIRLNCVSIDPSELYHITQSYYPPHSFRPLWRLCMWLLSVIRWFPLASWFSPFLPSSFHALMHCVLSLVWYQSRFGLKHLHGISSSDSVSSYQGQNHCHYRLVLKCRTEVCETGCGNSILKKNISGFFFFLY